MLSAAGIGPRNHWCGSIRAVGEWQRGDACFDIAYWRQKSGAFRYWSGTVFVMRLWFVLAFGLFFWFAGALSGLTDNRRGGVVLLWALFVAAELFALWLPPVVRRQAERAKIA